MSLTRRQLLQAFAACATLPLLACQRSIAGFSKDKIMQKYPMRTHAVGRFLIDLPEAAKDVSMSLKIFGEDIVWKASAEAQFQALVAARISGLKGPDPATQMFVREGVGDTPKTRIILFEEDSSRDGFIGYEGYRYEDAAGGYFILKGVAERKKVENVVPTVKDVLKLVHPRIGDEKVTDKGICTDHAFVGGVDPAMYEKIGLMASIGGIAIGFSTQVVDKVDDGPSLLQRAEGLIGFPDAKLLRKSKREVAGLNGAELAFIDTPDAGSRYSLEWEYDGKARSISAPVFSASMNSNGPISIPLEELLGLWDVILGSVRLRPGAV
jgi:hypothetical protein